MDFFARQDMARRTTRLLVVYFALAIVGIVLAVDIVVMLSLAYAGPEDLFGNGLAFVRHPAFATSTLITLLVILGGSAWRYWILSAGPEGLIRMVGAQRVDANSSDIKTRQLINTVEEMSIASGVPVPDVYVMPLEQSINAFVAGYTPDEAVLVVTRGLLETLDRDELQGVIGHEFSHLLNGDTRINLRLIALLAGILIIGQIGEVILRGGVHGGARVRRSNKQGQGGQIALGLALLVIGYVGLFFGRLIKAAISRQREFLADAAAVQFTRNQRGIGEALLKIKNANAHYLIAHKAEEISHMCLAPALQSLHGMFATHPPIDERIRAIDPSLLARDRARARVQARNAAQEQQVASQMAMGFTGGEVPLEPTAQFAADAIKTSAPAIIAAAGTTTPQHLEYAQSIYTLIPLETRAWLHRTDTAQTAIYAMILAHSASGTSDEALPRIALWHGEDAVDLARTLTDQFRRLGTRLRIPVVDLAMPALRRLDETGRAAFLERVEQLVTLDTRQTLFEFSLLALLQNQLQTQRRHRNNVRRLDSQSCIRILSVCAHATGSANGAREAAFQRAMHTLHVGQGALLAPGAISATQLADDLHHMGELSPILKKSFITVVADMFLEDGLIQVNEAELIRGICETMHVPMPPLLRQR